MNRPAFRRLDKEETVQDVARLLARDVIAAFMQIGAPKGVAVGAAQETNGSPVGPIGRV